MDDDGPQTSGVGESATWCHYCREWIPWTRGKLIHPHPLAVPMLAVAPDHDAEYLRGVRPVVDVRGAELVGNGADEGDGREGDGGSMTAVGHCPQCFRLTWELSEVGYRCGRRMNRAGDRCDGTILPTGEATDGD